MALQYISLNDEDRTYMVSELESDIDKGTLYDSDNISSIGKAPYPGILKNVFAQADDDQLASMLQPLLNSHERPRMLKGKMTTPKMRVNAHTMLAEGQFNNFYMR